MATTAMQSYQTQNSSTLPILQIKIDFGVVVDVSHPQHIYWLSNTVLKFETIIFRVNPVQDIGYSQ